MFNLSEHREVNVGRLRGLIAYIKNWFKTDDADMSYFFDVDINDLWKNARFFDIDDNVSLWLFDPKSYDGIVTPDILINRINQVIGDAERNIKNA